MAAPPPWGGWDEPPSCPPKGGRTIRMAAPPPWGRLGGGLPLFVGMCQIIRSQWGGGHLDEALGIFG